MNLPAGYLLEKVEGNNVRGWEIHKTRPRPGGRGDAVAAREGPRTIHVAAVARRRGGPKGLAEFDVPLVTVPDAALHTGQLTIRRSPLLELRTLDARASRGPTCQRRCPAKRRGRRRREPAGHPAVRGLHLRRGAVYGAAGGRAGRRPRVGHGADGAAARPSSSGTWRAASRSTCKTGRVYRLQMLLPDDLQLDRVSAPASSNMP